MSVSILVPFRHEKGTARLRNWRWLRKRWEALFPDWELVVGTDTETPFSKSVAVNDAWSKASGDVLVIADADSWCEADQIQRAVGYAESRQVLVVPWVNAYRLSQPDSDAILKMDPATPYPVSQDARRLSEEYKPSPSTAAMVIVIMRDDFERVGGFDPRFRGWGAEDVSFGISCTTLVGRTKIMMGESFALWHERPRDQQQRRVWGQDDRAEHNMALGQAYWDAYGKIHAMTALCMAHPLAGAKTPVGAGPHAKEQTPDLHVKQFQDAEDGVTMEEGQYRVWGGTEVGEHIRI